MKTNWTLVAVAILATGCASNSTAPETAAAPAQAAPAQAAPAPAATEAAAPAAPAAQEKPADAPASGPTPEEMKVWMEAMTPGDPHKRMESQNGEWTIQGRMWMDPKGEPMPSTGTATFRMILGGRYQFQEYKGDFMGMPYEGSGIAGYDNVTKEYFTTWVDNMSTGILYARGKADEKGVVTLLGEMDDPMNPGSKCRFKEVMSAPGADSFSFEMWMSDAKHPEYFKAFEMTYTRKK